MVLYTMGTTADMNKKKKKKSVSLGEYVGIDTNCAINGESLQSHEIPGLDIPPMTSLDFMPSLASMNQHKASLTV